MLTVTSAGMILPLSVSSFFSTSSATAMAFAPGRFARLSVIAASSVCLLPKSTYCDGSSAPSSMVATSRRYTGLPPKTPTTTLPTSSALVRKAPVSTMTSWLFVVTPPLRYWRFACCSMGTSPAGLRLRAASLAGSSKMRISRFAPPMSVVSATSGTCFSTSSACEAMRRSVR